MTSLDIPRYRLNNQQIGGQRFDHPGDVVGWLGAVQAQDFAGAKWALGLRFQKATETGIEQAFTDGSILRTHLMRPTWHFVTPSDIRWMLDLTAPRVKSVNAYMYRKAELDADVFKRSNSAMEYALKGGQQFTRNELRDMLHQAGVSTAGELRMGYILMQAELEGIICSGPRRGKQFTYMLLDERVPQGTTQSRQEALAELTRRYFFSHGPATIQDLMWWSGLTKAEAGGGLEEIKAELEHEILGGKSYWFSKELPNIENTGISAYLLPNYDEYGSYKDRSAVFDASNAHKLIFSHMIVMNGQIAGTWKRTLKKKAVLVEINSFTPLNDVEQKALDLAIQRYADYLGLPVQRVLKSVGN